MSREPKQNSRETEKVSTRLDKGYGGKGDYSADVPAIEVFTRKEINRMDEKTHNNDSPNKSNKSSQGR